MSDPNELPAWLSPAERAALANLPASASAAGAQSSAGSPPWQDNAAAQPPAPAQAAPDAPAAPWTENPPPPDAPAPVAAAPAPAVQPKPSPIEAALSDPGFAGFLAKRAANIADLKAAQGQADHARKWQDIANSFVRAGDTAAGRQTDEAALQQRLENANHPVANILQQQKFAQDETAGALQDNQLANEFQKRQVSLAMMDPRSDISKRAQLLAVTQGLVKPQDAQNLSADEMDMVLKGASFQEAKREHDQRLELEARKEIAAGVHQDKALSLSRAELAEKVRHDQAEEAAIGAKVGNKPISPQDENEAQSYLDAIDGIDQLAAAQKKGWRSAEALGVGQGGEYGAMKKALADTIAKAESRGRTNPAAAAKIANELPSSGVFSDATQQKYYSAKRDEYVKALANKVAELKASGTGQGQVQELEQALARVRGAGALGVDPIADAKAKLGPGEQLAADPSGHAHALGPGEQLPAGWKLVP